MIRKTPPNYMTITEASKKWGVSIWTVDYYLNNGRVKGAIKVKDKWFLPKNAEKPVDRRTREGESERKPHKKYKKRTGERRIPQSKQEVQIS